MLCILFLLWSYLLTILLYLSGGLGVFLWCFVAYLLEVAPPGLQLMNIFMVEWSAGGSAYQLIRCSVFKMSDCVGDVLKCLLLSINQRFSIYCDRWIKKKKKIFTLKMLESGNSHFFPEEYLKLIFELIKLFNQKHWVDSWQLINQLIDSWLQH